MFSSTYIRAGVDRLARGYLRGMELVARLLWGITIALAVVLTLIVVGSVLSRQFFGFVPVWSGELQRYLAIWMTLLLTGVLIYEDNHLGVNLLANRLPPRLQYGLRFLQLGLILVIGVILINWGTEYMLDSGTASTSSSMGFQMLWVYLILPITGWLITLFTIARMIRIVLEPELVTTGTATVENQIEEEASL